MMIATAPLAHSDEAQCRQVLGLCDQALKAQQASNALQEQIIKDQGTVINDQAAELSSQAFWKPVALGAVAAALVEGLVLVLKK